VIARAAIKPLTIGRLPNRSASTWRRCASGERQGLLPKPPRSPSGYRFFPAEATRRLKFIKRDEELGFSLSEIRELLALRMSPRTTSTEIRKRTEAKITDIERKIESLASMRKSLLKLARSCGGCSPLSECPILESLDREDG